MRSRSFGAVLITTGVLLASCSSTGPPPVSVAWTGCGSGLDCATVPVPVDYEDPGGETVDIAVVRHRIGGREDSQTPYAWAGALTDRLESGVLLTREGVGHGSWGTGNTCVTDAVQGYLFDGAVPAEGTTCVQTPGPTAIPPRQ